jgi:hypothetical protein
MPTPRGSQSAVFVLASIVVAPIVVACAAPTGGARGGAFAGPDAQAGPDALGATGQAPVVMTGAASPAAAPAGASAPRERCEVP